MHVSVKKLCLFQMSSIVCIAIIMELSQFLGFSIVGISFFIIYFNIVLPNALKGFLFFIQVEINYTMSSYSCYIIITDIIVIFKSTALLQK